MVPLDEFFAKLSLRCSAGNLYASAIDKYKSTWLLNGNSDRPSNEVLYDLFSYLGGQSF